MSETTERKGIAELSIDTRLLANHLSKANPGDVLTYDDLSKVIGRDVRGKQGYQRLQSARRVVRRENDMIFATIAKVGLRCCDDAGKVRIANGYIDRVHSAAKKGINVVSAINYDKLENNDRIALNATASHLGVLHQITTAKAQKKLTQAVTEVNDKLPLAKTLEQFK